MSLPSPPPPVPDRTRLVWSRPGRGDGPSALSVVASRPDGHPVPRRTTPRRHPVRRGECQRSPWDMGAAHTGRRVGAWRVRRPRATRPQAGAPAAHRLVQASGGVQPDADRRYRRDGRARSVGRELRTGRGVCRAPSGASGGDLRSLHVAPDEDRADPFVRRNRARDRRVLRRGLRGVRGAGLRHRRRLPAPVRPAGRRRRPGNPRAGAQGPGTDARHRDRGRSLRQDAQ